MDIKEINTVVNFGTVKELLKRNLSNIVKLALLTFNYPTELGAIKYLN